jgi:hypothetical protein
MKIVFQYCFATTFLFLLCSVSSCSNINHTLTDEEKERTLVLNYKIKTITELRTSVFNGVNQPEKFSRIKHFDSNGFLTSETDYKMDGSPDDFLNYEYDNSGNLVLIKAFNPDSSLLFRETRSYDKNKSRKEFYFFLPDGTYKYRNIATYDSEGRMKELAWYWPTGFKSKNVYQYDDGKKISDEEFNPEGALTYKWIYKYDDKENLIEATQYSPLENINRKIIYEYNNSDQLIRQTNYVGAEIQNSISFFYDEKKLLLSKTELSASKRVTSIIRYQYEYR